MTRINHKSHFAWQAQFLVKLEHDSWCFPSCTGHCIWQAQYLVMLEGNPCCSAAQCIVDVSCDHSHKNDLVSQVQYVMLEGGSCGSAHCTGRFMCDGDQS